MDRRRWILDNSKGLCLDVGSADGAIYRGSGLEVVYLDVNLYRYPYFVQGDAEHLPFRDGCFDTVTLAEILEHLPNPVNALREAKRVSRDRVLITVPNEYLWSSDKHPFIGLEERLKLEGCRDKWEFFERAYPNAVKPCLRYAEKCSGMFGHIRYYDKDKLKNDIEEAGLTATITDLFYDGWSFLCAYASIKKPMLKLNLGSYVVMLPPPWINIDVIDLTNYAKARGYLFMCHDVTKGLPFRDGTVSAINLSHLLEHLTYQEGESLLKECYRVLQKGGALRVSLPDTKLLAKKYLEGNLEDLKFLGPEVYSYRFPVQRFWHILSSGHRSAYDEELLRAVLREVGFILVEKPPKQLEGVVEVYPEVSLVVYAVKGGP